MPIHAKPLLYSTAMKMNVFTFMKQNLAYLINDSFRHYQVLFIFEGYVATPAK